MALLFLFLAVAMRGQSALDGFDPNANGSVFVVVVQPDGKILLGGDFTTLSPNGGGVIQRNHIARLNSDGTPDVAFNPNANASVNAIALQADGKILVGGVFSTIGGQSRQCLARLNPTTGLADSFDPNPDAFVFSIAVQSDGKILAGGFFEMIGGQSRRFIARLDPTTGLADSFNPSANSIVRSIAVQGDGKILAGGNFTLIGGQVRNRIARINATTGLVDAFTPNANNEVYAIAVQPDGKVLVGGDFNGANSIGGATRNRIARLDPNTGLADSFDPNANERVASIALQADGKILPGGSFTNIGGQTRHSIARLDATTGLADSFDPNPNPNEQVYSIAVQADGKALAGGDFTTLAPNGGAAVARNHIARLETDGRLDQTLNLNAVGFFFNDVTAVQADGKILIGGNFKTVLGVTRNNVARLNTDGTLDMAFDPNANGDVHSIAVQADGKILIAGDFNGPNSIGGQARNYLARLDATTGLADSFNPNPNAFVQGIEVQKDGNILICGDFSAVGGQTRNYIARLNPTTGLADSFNPNPNAFVYSVTSQADGKVLAGGFFTRVGGQPRNYIGRLDATSGFADSFNAHANDLVFSIIVQPDGKILACGNFFGLNSIGGQTRDYIARLDPLTGLADSFNPNPNSLVRTAAIQSNGKILVGGGFSQIGGQKRRAIARLDPTTGFADSLDPNATNGVDTIALQADGKVVVGGSFFSIGGQTRNSFARLSNDAAALQNLVVTRTTLDWSLGGSAPQFARATFEYSTDNATYTYLGDGTALDSHWTFTGLNLPGGNFYIRARGYYRSGKDNRSQSIMESRRNAFLRPTAVSITTSLATTIGGTISGVTTLSGGLAPTGTITFSVYGPDDLTCGGAIAFSSTSTVNGNGNYSSASFTPALAGTYRFVVIYSGDEQNASSFTACNDASGSVVVSKISPTIATVASSPITLGGDVSDSAILAGGFSPSGTITFTLFGPDNAACAGTPIFTSTKPVNGNGNYNSGSFTPTSPGTYRFVASYSGDANNNAVANACNDAGESVVVNPAPTTLGNISTRLRVETGDNVLIGGFIVTGTQSKRVIVRAIGPSLPFAGALTDPVLELRDSAGGLIRSNDNWRSDQESEIIATTIPPSNDLESAIVETLPANGSAYTAIVRGVDNGTGVGLIEAYDLDSTVNSKLANISTRGLVQTGNDVMIAGTIVLGQASQRVLVRALGPSLPVQGKLADPTLELRDGSGTLIRANDNWRSDQESEIIATTIPPSNDLESAIVETLPANGAAYTAIVSGMGGSTGVAIVEVYALN